MRLISALRARAATRCRGDAGAAGALEFALIAPVFLALVFLVVQGGLYWEAQNVVDSIASDTGRVVRSHATYPGVAVDQLPSQAQMQAAAARNVTALMADQHGINAGHLVSSVRVQRVSPPTWDAIQVTITGKAIRVLGFITPATLSETVTGPYEGFRPQDVR